MAPYQHPNTYHQPAPTAHCDPWDVPPATNSYNYSSSAPPAMTSNATVRIYGPASSSCGGTVQGRALADIMASQDRDKVEAKHNGMFKGRLSRRLSRRTPRSKAMEKRDKRFYSDAVHPQRREMKTERKSKTIAGSLGGAAVGILIGGPIGLVLCGAAGGYASNKISKQGERRMQREFEQANYQKYASQSPASNAVYV